MARTVPFNDLRVEARACLDHIYKMESPADADDAASLGRFLVTAFATASTGLVELHLYPPQFAWRAGERPTASPLARLQAEKGAIVTNLRHEAVQLDGFNRHLLRHLDGSRDRAALADVVEELERQGELALEHEGQPLQDPEQIKEVARASIDSQLPKLAQQALLVG